MAPSKKSKITRNIPLEKMLTNLGVSATELDAMTREEQSAKYDVLMRGVKDVQRLCCLCGGKDLWCQSTGEWYCSRCLE
jgi:hypothetical protein